MASRGPPESRRFVVPLAVSLLGIVLLGTALVFGAFMLGWPFDLSVQAIEETIRSWGALGVVASIGLMILHSFVPYLPRGCDGALGSPAISFRAPNVKPEGKLP